MKVDGMKIEGDRFWILELELDSGEVERWLYIDEREGVRHILKLLKEGVKTSHICLLTVCIKDDDVSVMPTSWGEIAEIMVSLI